MLRPLVTLLIAALLAGPAWAGGQDRDHDSDTEADCWSERPVLVELFTSQGCPLCPDANTFLGEIDRHDNVFALAYAVSYWDMYGWVDTYARPEYVQRQRMYLPHLDVARLYTPQFVVDGMNDAPGWNRDKVIAAVEERLCAMPASPTITIEDGPFNAFVVHVDGEAPEENLDVWLAAYAPGWAMVEIGAGENEGLDMPHYNMVKSLTYLGSWSGGEASFMGESMRRYGTVAILQGAHGGPIYGFAHAAPAEEDARRH
ncbi:DUF1223 domain-containing protein [Maricaulis sp.]|uniref:DUF1223 domain-containing protein n=1 Tax=Maricaulis sp. TaxID=1486257 RepID=UPI002607253A|nr:DUF1223 domain-containing protein [Maricaulis sp.]